MALVLLIPITFLCLWFTVRSRFCEQEERQAFVLTFLAFHLIIFVLTEFLSLFDMVTRNALITAWTLLALTFCATGLMALNSHGRSPPRAWRESDAEFSQQKYTWLLIAIVLLTAVTLVIALVRPPNTWDSMTYHLARVATWIQQGSISFFPTSIARQNYSMPLAEYVILHTQLLSMGDRFANMAQWSGYIANIVLSSLLARELGLNRYYQVLAAFFAAVLPMAVFQSTSTQNDLLIAAFFLSFIWAMMRLVEQPNWRWVIVATLGLGLALLTKGTAYPYCAGLGIVLGIHGLLRHRRSGKLGRLMLAYTAIIAGALVLSAPHLARNQSLYGHMLGADFANNQQPSRPTIGTVSASVAKNAAIHLATPNPSVNQGMQDILIQMFEEQVTDDEINYLNNRFEVDFILQEDFAGNPLHLALITMGLLLLPLNYRRLDRRYVSCFIGVLLAIVICAVAVRWQPWGSRLHLPLFLAAIPLSLGVLSQVGKWGSKILFYSSAAGMTYVIPILLLNPAARLVSLGSEMTLFNSGRQALYFSQRPEAYPPYLGAMSVVNELQPDRIGLLLGGDDWEYPIWVLLGRHAVSGQPIVSHLKHGGRVPRRDDAGSVSVIIRGAGYSNPASIPGYEAAYRSGLIEVHVSIPAQPGSAPNAPAGIAGGGDT
jgi:hypothetical protein